MKARRSKTTDCSVMQSWSIYRDSSNESVYGQEGAREEREAFQLEDPSVLAIKGLG